MKRFPDRAFQRVSPRHTKQTQSTRGPQLDPGRHLIARGDGDDPQHANRVGGNALLDSAPPPGNDEHPAARQDDVVRTFGGAGEGCVLRVLGTPYSLEDSRGPVQQASVNRGQLGWCDVVVVRGCEAVVEPVKRHFGRLPLTIRPGVVVKKARQTRGGRGEQLHVLVEPTTPAVAPTVEKGHVLVPARACSLLSSLVGLAAAQGRQDGPRGGQVALVQGLVLAPVAVLREEQDVGAGEGELVGDEDVAGAVDVGDFEAGGADVAPVPQLGLCCVVAGGRTLEGGFLGQGVGEEEADLE